MKKFFFILFILALFILEVKSDKVSYLGIINCLKNKGKWNELLMLIKNHGDDDDDYEDSLISLCTRYCNKDDCEKLITNCFDFYD